jgi:UDP-glucose 4-epimerase
LDPGKPPAADGAAEFHKAALKDEPIRVFGDGRQTRNFTYVTDCIETLVRLLESPAAEGEIVNIGSPHEISILNLAERVKSIIGSSSRIVIVPYDQAYPEGGFEDMRRRVPCICRISRLIGWSPTTTMDEMIAQTIGPSRHQPPLPAALLLNESSPSALLPQS